MFGGEVSGHYYFRDFYCADSGTIPALLILELLSVEGVKLSTLLDRYRSTYFISGEINSTVAGRRRRSSPRSRQRYADAKIGHLDGVSVDYDDWHFNVRTSNTEPLMRLCLESLVSVEDMERRRDEVLDDHPLVKLAEPADAALARAADAGIHCLPIPTPFRIGRVNTYLIDDDPLTLVDSGPNSGTALDALERALAAHGRRVEDLELIVISHQHIDHLGLVAILARRSGARGRRAGPARAVGRALERGDGRRRRVRRAGHVRARHPARTCASRCSASRRATAAGARRRRSRGRSRPARSSCCATARCACCTAPATRRRTRSSTTSGARIVLGADHLIKHISSNPLISRPLEAPAAPAAGAAASGRAPARAGDLHGLAARDAGDGRRRPRARRPRRAGDRPRRAHRRALPDARAPRREDPPADRQGAASRPTRSRSRCGATSRSRRPT